MQTCVLRPSARISARCDTLAHAGACFHMVTYPGQLLQVGFWGATECTPGAGAQNGVPLHAGSGVLSTPYAAAARASQAQTKCEILSCYNVCCRAQAGGADFRAGSQRFTACPLPWLPFLQTPDFDQSELAVNAPPEPQTRPDRQPDPHRAASSAQPAPASGRAGPGAGHA